MLSALRILNPAWSTALASCLISNIRLKLAYLIFKKTTNNQHLHTYIQPLPMVPLLTVCDLPAYTSPVTFGWAAMQHCQGLSCIPCFCPSERNQRLMFLPCMPELCFLLQDVSQDILSVTDFLNIWISECASEKMWKEVEEETKQWEKSLWFPWGDGDAWEPAMRTLGYTIHDSATISLFIIPKKRKKKRKRRSRRKGRRRRWRRREGENHGEKEEGERRRKRERREEKALSFRSVIRK